jgi:DNA-binding NarL/FixJ family response regulator
VLPKHRVDQRQLASDAEDVRHLKLLRGRLRVAELQAELFARMLLFGRSRGAPQECQSVPLTAKQEAIALALAAGKSVVEAAAECGRNRRTVFRWLHADFERAISGGKGGAESGAVSG